MEEMKVTPRKTPTCEESLPISPVVYKTPLKQCESRLTHTSYQGSVGTFSVLSNHITPPSGLTKFIARNPFDADLTSRLHLSVISPTIFNKASPMTQDSPFAWTIDELANMKPVKIEEFPMQQAHCSDPEIELKAQEAINKFFSENQIHPSPWDEKREPPRPLLPMTPTRGVEGLNTKGESQKSTKDNWSQTVLSLPPDLPKHVEEALKPYFTFTQDQQVDNDDANSSNNSLRRKLFFNHDESTEDENECSLILSPIKNSSSPPQSGLFVHGTPLRRGSLGMQRTYGTPYVNSRNLSPPNMSPICNPTGDMSCQSVRPRCRSGNATRLDFSAHMSVDTSLSDDREVEKPQLLKYNEEFSVQQSEVELKAEYSEKCDQNETIEMVSLLQENTPHKKLAARNTEVLDKLKDAADWYKTVSSESYRAPRNTTLVGYSEQSSVFNAQDTGYQTYSMNNTTANTDNRSITPIKKAFNWNERINGIPISEEMTISDWQENIKTMFSSTPSKLVRQREH